MKTPDSTPSASPSPRLVMCAALWSLQGHPSAGREWSLARKLKEIKAAGFEGVAALATPELTALLATHDLRIMGAVFTSTAENCREAIASQVAGGASVINVQLGDHDTPVADSVRMAVEIVKEGKRQGAAIHIETHRDTSTETPEKFAEIATLYRRQTGALLPTSWDHSHFCVSKHILPADYSTRLLAHPELIQHSRIFHLRPFNSQHCQVPVTNGRGRLTPEFRDYLAFVEALFALWLAGPPPRPELWVTPELGTTHGYHVSTNPPVWPDALRAREEILLAWQRALDARG